MTYVHRQRRPSALPRPFSRTAHFFKMSLLIRLQLVSFIITCFALSCYSLTLSEVYNQLSRVQKESVLTPALTHPEYHHTKQREVIGSFRGEPIFNRQYSGFVDDNGVPVPVLPYAKSTEENPDAWRRG
ncbi:hypothetical protein QR680_000746 [Steinernema hermaphroditum]|uniref:Uncharacterized protein n=1 Tax=Steinernema hermaphroditum TaxID=289476 RepID=A0AA39GVQ4_9BILA|nr:hypothetical protein QR680_000746 [Steinernema hermaphroditum]